MPNDEAPDSPLVPDTAPASGELPRYPWYHWRRLGFNFLTVSVIVHLLFACVAAYLIVQVIPAKRKQAFASAPQSANAPTHALEHKVQMQKKQQTMSAPVAVKRVTTTGMSKVALPAMPAMPSQDAAMVPVAMAGMGGAGLGLGVGGSGGSGGGTGGGGLSLFGMRGGKGLKGSLYDLKQTSSKTPTSIKSIEAFVHELNLFLLGGWHEAFLAKYFRAPTSLYATQIFIPLIPSVGAPKAFGVEGVVQPALWMALYHGEVSPPVSGTYHFVGAGDNILIVRIKGVIVLDKSWNYQSIYGIDRNYKPLAVYDYHFGSVPDGFSKGQGVEMQAGEFYDMQVLLGDDGGATFFSLLVQKDGEEYAKTSAGLPILPVFRTSADPPPPGDQPPFKPDGPIWRVRDALPTPP